MVNYDKFMEGTERYIESEILKKINGYQKWLLGTAVGIAMRKADNIYNALCDNSIINMLELIDDNDNVDDDIIYEELKKQAKGNPVTIEIPLIGKITMDESDVEKWHTMIHS